MKYKIGDKVRVKSLRWYNENKDKYGYVQCGYKDFTENMRKYCGDVVTISGFYYSSFYDFTTYNIAEEDDYSYAWSDDMFEGLAEDTIQPVVFENIVFPNENYADKVELCLGNDYEIVVEDGRTFVQRKKPKYPTTYDECCELLGKTKAYQSVSGYKTELLEDLQKLLICRDAYWKIADFKYDVNIIENYFYIINKRGSIIKDCCMCFNHILAFPTAEMRDAFYENFKDLIENCKEVL